MPLAAIEFGCLMLVGVAVCRNRVRLSDAAVCRNKFRLLVAAVCRNKLCFFVPVVYFLGY